MTYTYINWIQYSQMPISKVLLSVMHLTYMYNTHITMYIVHVHVILSSAYAHCICVQVLHTCSEVLSESWMYVIQSVNQLVEFNIWPKALNLHILYIHTYTHGYVSACKHALQKLCNSCEMPVGPFCSTMSSSSGMGCLWLQLRHIVLVKQFYHKAEPIPSISPPLPSIHYSCYMQNHDTFYYVGWKTSWKTRKFNCIHT